MKDTDRGRRVEGVASAGGDQRARAGRSVWPWRPAALGALACLTLLAWAPASSGAVTQRVFFKDGRSLDIVDLRIDSGQAVLTMPGGNIVAFAAERIVSVEPIATPGNSPQGEPIREGRVVEPVPAPTDEQSGRDRETTRAAIEKLIRDAAGKYNLEVDLLAAVIAVESGYDVDAVSPKGALGLMQLMPATARSLAVRNPFDPRENIDGGARYLRRLLDENDNQYWRALAAYNAGAGRVAHYDGIPPYRETIEYIRRVLDLYAAPRPLHRRAAD